MVSSKLNCEISYSRNFYILLKAFGKSLDEVITLFSVRTKWCDSVTCIIVNLYSVGETLYIYTTP